jgi:hypothetical protein
VDVVTPERRSRVDWEAVGDWLAIVAAAIGFWLILAIAIVAHAERLG